MFQLSERYYPSVRFESIQERKDLINYEFALFLAVAFQFKNNANKSASIRNISKNQETTWSEELVEEVLSNGGLLQSRVRDARIYIMHIHVCITKLYLF